MRSLQGDSIQTLDRDYGTVLVEHLYGPSQIYGAWLGALTSLTLSALISLTGRAQKCSLTDNDPTLPPPPGPPPAATLLPPPAHTKQDNTTR